MGSLLSGSPPARADAPTLCATTAPIPPELAENDPTYGSQCGLPPGGGGGPCPAPAAPTLEADSVRAQGMVLDAVVPSSVTSAAAVWWEAYVEDPATGARVKLWTHRSVQGVPAGGWLPGDTVRFGAPGLVEGGTHYFRVAFEDPNGYKTCLSPWSQAFVTPAFPGDGPSVPSGLWQKVRDDFHRPPTDPAHGATVGDGLGPDAVWWTSDAANPVHEAHIWQDGEHASVTPTSSIVYKRLSESHPSTYAQLKVRVNFAESPPGPVFKYNLQVQARIGEPDPNTGASPSYAAKLVYGARGCDRPALLLFQLPNEYDDAKCMDSDGDGTIEPLPAGVFCDNAPPLDVADPANPDVSLPVWLRIEVRNNDDGYPVITGQAYWDDGNGGWITCKSPAAERIDTGDPWSMADVRGDWGASFHEKAYLIDAFEAGDGTPGGSGP